MKLVATALLLVLLFACAQPASRSTAGKNEKACANGELPYEGKYGPYRFPALCREPKPTP